MELEIIREITVDIEDIRFVKIMKSGKNRRSLYGFLMMDISDAGTLMIFIVPGNIIPPSKDGGFYP